VFINRERDAILGQLNQRGERVPGLIDKFSGALHISDVIGRVAYDTNVQGDPLGACHLYALANVRIFKSNYVFETLERKSLIILYQHSKIFSVIRTPSS
jgi:hypothetical protein